MRVVIDTNAIVSALVFGGVPRQVLELAETGRCTFFYSAEIQHETRRLLGEKFGWSDKKLDEALPKLGMAGKLVVPRFRIDAVHDDPDDNRILECARSAQAEFVVSGDQHLLRLRAYQSISIVTPREFSMILKASSFSDGDGLRRPRSALGEGLRNQISGTACAVPETATGEARASEGWPFGIFLGRCQTSSVPGRPRA